MYHGTGQKNKSSILESGISKRKRHHVHLSEDIKTAVQVGTRHGKPLVFELKSGVMHVDGHKFYKSENDVWLTDNVPSTYFNNVLYE